MRVGRTRECRRHWRRGRGRGRSQAHARLGRGRSGEKQEYAPWYKHIFLGNSGISLPRSAVPSVAPPFVFVVPPSEDRTDVESTLSGGGGRLGGGGRGRGVMEANQQRVRSYTGDKGFLVLFWSYWYGIQRESLLFCSQSFSPCFFTVNPAPYLSLSALLSTTLCV